MAKAWPVRVGVPAAGHITSRGWWHPGSAANCGKCVRRDKAPFEGCSRCECGCKYWSDGRCIDCSTRYDPARHDN